MSTRIRSCYVLMGAFERTISFAEAQLQIRMIPNGWVGVRSRDFSVGFRVFVC